MKNKIKKIFICNHSHTDIGFTDYQDVCFRQHSEFVEQSLNLIEKTEHYPEEAKYRWTIETTGPFINYLKYAKSKQIDRFIKWHKAGRIDVAAMQYNFTPLLNVEQMIRSLYPIRTLRNEFGININSAMQDDVNGVSWLFADLFSSIGVDFFSLSANPIRGARVKPFPGAFKWIGPSGKKIIAWNGYHYLFGRNQVGFGNEKFTKKLLPNFLNKLENDSSYNYDFMYCESTHPIRVDNGPPDERISNFVKHWNENNDLNMELINLSRFGELLKTQYSENMVDQTGDWTDHWTDGPSSSSYETSLNRRTHELILAAETIDSLLPKNFSEWTKKRTDNIFENMTLFDEHTWGAYSSIEAPESLFTKALWNKKASYCYNATMETHDVLARASNNFAKSVSQPLYDTTSEFEEDQIIEGSYNLGDHDPELAFPNTNSDELLVINTLPWKRKVIIEEPESRWGAAPVGMLDIFFNRGSGWGGNRPILPMKKITCDLPAMGYKFVSISNNSFSKDLVANKNIIENNYYRITINKKDGCVDEFFDKNLNHNFASTHQGHKFSQYIYEEVDSELGRLAINNYDFSHEDFFIGLKDAPYSRTTAKEISVEDAKIENGCAIINVEIKAKGIRKGVCKIYLESNIKSLSVDWLIDKKPVIEPEAVFFAFPFNLEESNFNLDLNGIAAQPNNDQLQGSSKDWYPVQRWVDVSDQKRGVTMTPIDAPLVNLGGITAGKWTGKGDLEPEGPNIYSWAINNHWMVNFKASQEGEIPFRFKFQTHEGSLDNSRAYKFGLNCLTPPIILRDKKRLSNTKEKIFIEIDSNFINYTLKPADDLNGIIIRAQNLSPKDIKCNFKINFNIKKVFECNILEEKNALVKKNNNDFILNFEKNEIKTIRLIL